MKNSERPAAFNILRAPDAGVEDPGAPGQESLHPPVPYGTHVLARHRPRDECRDGVGSDAIPIFPQAADEAVEVEARP